MGWFFMHQLATPHFGLDGLLNPDLWLPRVSSRIHERLQLPRTRKFSSKYAQLPRAGNEMKCSD